MRAVGYLRVSTEEQKRHGWNLGADREQIEAIAATNGWDLVEIYDDGGRQGDDPDRPGFNAMIAALDKTDVIIMRSLDRLSRDTFLYALATKAIRAAEVAVHTFNGPVDLDTPEGELANNVLAAIHRFEKRQIGVRVKQAKGARGRAGRYNGGGRPYGYQLCDGDLVIDLVEAKVIERIYADTLARVSQWSMAKTLNREGIPSATGGTWIQASIRKILDNPIYMGKIRLNGAVHPGKHDPIIDEATWHEAKRIRAEAASQRGNGGGRNPKGAHLFVKGLLRCGRCGGPLVPRTVTSKRTGTAQTYFCLNRNRDIDLCSQLPIDRAPVDEAMLTELGKRFLDVEEMRTRYAARRAADAATVGEVLNQAQAEALKAAERLGRVTRAFQDGYLEPADYAEQRTALVAEREAAEAAVACAEKRAEAVGTADVTDEVLDRLADLRAAVLRGVGLAPDLNALRRVLRELFEQVAYWPAECWGDALVIPGTSAGRTVGTHVYAGQAALVPVLKTTAILGWEGDPLEAAPVARRVAFDLDVTKYGALSP